MANKIEKVPFFSLNLQEFLSLALETLLEDLQGQVAYWFVHNNETDFWLRAGYRSDTTVCFSQGQKPFYAQQEINNIRDFAHKMNDITFMKKSQLKEWNTKSFSSAMVIPIMSGSERLATIVIFNIQRELNLSQFKRKLSLFIRQIQITLRSLQNESLAYIDDLTRLYNTRAFDIFLDQSFDRAKRFALCFSVLIIDIDYLKKVNDTYGHLTGSQLLREVAKIVRSSCREKDKVFRYGGDEFAVILESSDAKSAHVIAERMRIKIEDTVFEVQKHLKIKITVCIGIASYPENASRKKDLIQLADQAMYSAKNSHRNTVSLA